MTIQTIKGIYSMVDDVLGGGNGNPDEVIVAVHHALKWIDEHAPHTEWRGIIEVIFNTYVEAFVYGAGRPTTGTDLERAMYRNCEYLQEALGDVIHNCTDDDTFLDGVTHIFA